jgi:multiple sugar transport system substrate-binding protein
MITELATGTTTELYYASFPALDQYQAMGALQPLDPYVNVKELQDAFFPVQKTDLVRNGQTVAYMCGLTADAMFYHQDLLDAAGVKPPTSYDELLAAAKQLTNAPNQYGFGVVTADQVQILEKHTDFIIGYGSLWGNGKDVLINSDKNVEAITALKNLVDAGVTPANQNNPVLRPLFFDGKLAIWFDGPWMPGLSDKPISGLAAAKIPLPSGKFQGGPQIVIMTTGGANKPAAGKYLDFISQPEWQKTMTVESGINSGRAGIDYSDFLAKNPWYQPFLDSLNSVVPDPAPGWGKINAQWRKVVQNKLAEMYAQNRPVKQTLDDIQAQVEDLVKQNL